VGALGAESEEEVGGGGAGRSEGVIVRYRYYLWDRLRRREGEITTSRKDGGRKRITCIAMI